MTQAARLAFRDTALGGTTHAAQVARTAHAAKSALLLATLALPLAAQAGIDSSVMFSQTGQVNIYFTGNAGGFDHILEPVIVAGNAPWSAFVPTPLNLPGFPAPWIIGTDGAAPMSLVGDPGGARYPNTPSTVAAWGDFGVVTAGTEITFRLTNLLSSRIGGIGSDEWGTIVSQVFSGTSAGNNTSYGGGLVSLGTPGAPTTALGGGYTFVDFTSPTEINVFFEDLDTLRPEAERWQNMSVRLVLTPVPEPATYAMLLLGLMGPWARRRASGPSFHDAGQRPGSWKTSTLTPPLKAL